MELTKQQINTIVRLAMDDKLHYYGTYEVCPDYQQFVEETFGEYHFELHEEWQSCYNYEFSDDWYVYLVTGQMSQEMKEWIKEGLEQLNELDLEEDLDEDLVESE
jgi:hypothetical protein